jgi:uncharacterized protein
MDTHILIPSESKNNYLYNRNTKLFHFLHPVLKHLYALKNRNVNIDDWFLNIDQMVTIEPYGNFEKDVIDYYLKKFKFIESYPNNKNVGETGSLKLNPAQIESLIANCDNLAFEVTQKCNLNCIYCTYGEMFDWFEKRKNADLDFKKARILLDFFLEKSESNYNRAKTKNLQIGFYGGEPLLNFTLIKQIVDYVNSKKLKKTTIQYGMTTNAILLKKYYKFLVDNNFQILISLDGNEKHNCYRITESGKPAYDAIYSSIRFLQNQNPLYFNSKVRFNSVLTNKGEIPEILNYFKEQFDSIPSLNEISKVGLKLEKKADYHKIYKSFSESISKLKDKKLEKDILDKIPGYGILYKFEYNTPFVFEDYNAFIFDVKQVQLLAGTCLPFSRKLFMTVSGRILPCENVGHTFSLGFVNDEKVLIDYELIAQRYTKYAEKMNGQCKNCYLNKICGQCVFFLDIEKHDPTCEDFISKTAEFSKYLEKRINILEKEPESYCKNLK